MDEYFFSSGKRRRSRAHKSGDDKTGDLFGSPSEPVSTNKRTAPYQDSSDTSREAAERISPRAEDHKAICYRAIVRATRLGDFITRKEIADAHFDGKQNYVTGRVHDLIHLDKLVYERPVRINGVISRDAETGKILREKRDGSVLLAARGCEPSGDPGWTEENSAE